MCAECCYGAYAADADSAVCVQSDLACAVDCGFGLVVERLRDMVLRGHSYTWYILWCFWIPPIRLELVIGTSKNGVQRRE